MNEEAIVTQLGLVLTTLRYARRALEDIERNTAKYGGISFANALAAGPRFGEPPLFSGALKVYVVNINDLTGSGVGGFLEGIFGTVGRFFGGLIGGVAGGLVGGILTPVNLVTLAVITDRIVQILDRLGPSSGGASSSGDSVATLRAVNETIRELKALFQTATTPGGGPGGAPASPQGRDWLQILQVGSGVVDGLIILVPILIGAIASLIVRLDNIKLAIIELLQFALRNVFLLRGVSLITLFDTVSAGAQLAANLLRIIETPLTTILRSVFTIISTLLETTVSVIRMIAPGLQRTMNALLDWFERGVLRALVTLGDTRVFRLLFHLVDILPAILPALIRLRDPEGKGPGLTSGQEAALAAAARRAIPAARTRGSGAPGSIARFPDLSAGLPAAGAITTAITAASGTVSTQLTTITRNTETMFDNIAGEFRGADMGTADIERQIGELTPHAARLAGTLERAQTAAQTSPATGMEQIARAYEGWLSGGGLNTLLTRISDHFARQPAIPSRVVQGAAAGREEPRATVEIGEVNIVIEPPPPAAPPPNTGRRGQTQVQDFMAEMHDWNERGGRAAYATPLGIG